jgi:hypothetical protein
MGKIYRNVIRIFVFIILTFLSGEIICRMMGLTPGFEYYMSVRPHNVFESDSILAWKLKEGDYLFSVYDSSNTFPATVNTKRNRITYVNKTNIVNDVTKPTVHVYGCSYTFGLSVSDTQTACYKLQHQLQNYNVENKGVPGYGLTQMYLLLQKSLMERDTPEIAVFNYGSFHNERTALHKNGSAMILKAITNSYSSSFKNMMYPYMEIINDSLILNYSSIKNMPRYWPLHKHSSFIALLNDNYFYYFDKKNESYLDLISMKTALKIMQFCESNHIIPVFASVTPESTQILDLLDMNGYFTLNYGITVGNDQNRPTIYNCGRLDPAHPSEYTHSLYAQKLYHFIIDSIHSKIFIN